MSRHLLLLDDQPDRFREVRRTLHAQSWTVTTARDLDTAWECLTTTNQPFDLVWLDLLLDRSCNEFEAEWRPINDQLVRSNSVGFPMTGQTLGLRLWRERKTKRLPYFYASNNFDLWMHSVDSNDPEFKVPSLNLIPTQLAIKKTEIFSKNIESILNNVLLHWKSSTWL